MSPVIWTDGDDEPLKPLKQVITEVEDAINKLSTLLKRSLDDLRHKRVTFSDDELNSLWRLATNAEALAKVAYEIRAGAGARFIDERLNDGLELTELCV